MNRIKSKLKALIEGARILGLSNDDLNKAEEFFNHNEYWLCYDTIITQMYEADIEINRTFYEIICNIANDMNLSDSSYGFMKDLIRTGNEIPKAVKEQLSIIMKRLSENN